MEESIMPTQDMSNPGSTELKAEEVPKVDSLLSYGLNPWSEPARLFQKMLKKKNEDLDKQLKWLMEDLEKRMQNGSLLRGTEDQMLQSSGTIMSTLEEKRKKIEKEHLKRLKPEKDPKKELARIEAEKQYEIDKRAINDAYEKIDKELREYARSVHSTRELEFTEKMIKFGVYNNSEELKDGMTLKQLKKKRVKELKQADKDAWDLNNRADFGRELKRTVDSYNPSNQTVNAKDADGLISMLKSRANGKEERVRDILQSLQHFETDSVTKGAYKAVENLITGKGK